MDRLEDLLHNYCDMIEDELADLLPKMSKSNPIAPSDIEIMDMLLHSLKSLKTIVSMLEYNDGYSGSYYPHPRYESRYSGRYSGKRDSMGRYTRDSEKTELMNRLEGMMNNVRTEDEAVAIRNAMEAVDRINGR